MLRLVRIARYRGDHGDSCAQRCCAPQRQYYEPAGRGWRAVALGEHRAAAAERGRILPQASAAPRAVGDGAPRLGLPALSAAPAD